MINFRFHLLSLVAVFLALAVGIVMGSTVIDRAIVDGLENQIGAVERRADQRRVENRSLKRQVENLDRYVTDAAPFVIDGRLEGATIVIVAARGVDEEVARDSTELLRRAGASVPAVLWVESSWASDAPGLKERLGGVLDIKAEGTKGAGADNTVESLRVRAADALSARLAEVHPVIRPTPEALPTVDVLERFQTAGLLTFTTEGGGGFSFGTYPAAPPRILLLDTETKQESSERTGSSTTLAKPTSKSSVPLLLVRSFVQRNVPVLLGWGSLLSGGGFPADASIVFVRNDNVLASQMSTVDGVDQMHGQIAVVLAMERLAIAQFGHYGTGPGAKGRLPE